MTVLQPARANALISISFLLCQSRKKADNKFHQMKIKQVDLPMDRKMEKIWQV
jgi:hypothetical protein